MPVKAVLAMMGRIEEVYRLPMVPMKKETRARLQQVAAESRLAKRVRAGFGFLTLTPARFDPIQA